jgi:starch-binding outer membrane protein, SusD/RagB family
MKNKIIYLIPLLLLQLYACKSYLDLKPDKKLELPQTLQDCQALLTNYNLINGAYPAVGEISSDDYYLSDANYNSLELDERNEHIWRADANVNAGIWSGGYSRILVANQVLETLGNMTPAANDQTTWNGLKGAALFFRAYSLLEMAQIWTKPYDATTADQDMGIPIRLTPDINEVTDRGTVAQTYDRITTDLKEAISLLPAGGPAKLVNKTALPVKATAQAALARTYLIMGDYANAGSYADSSLGQYNMLMDYNQLDPTAGNPIAEFNTEVLFDATSGAALSLYYGNVNDSLYNAYDDKDTRKTIFFNNRGNGTYAFKGGYTGQPNFIIFTGLATDEVYLISAESKARAGNTGGAMTDLNTLLQNRIKPPFTPLTAANADDALVQVLQQRRKELLFRGLRWTDLRRLNKDPRFAVTLTRHVNDSTYTLPPNDLRYTLLIPRDVLNLVKIPQNPR